MKTAILLAAIVIGQWVLILAMPKPTKVIVDCGMASFHPDYTAEMRKACNERFIKK